LENVPVVNVPASIGVLVVTDPVIRSVKPVNVRPSGYVTT